MKVLVTGANSLLGANIMDELLKAGYAVRGMVRRKASIPFEAPQMEVSEGSIESSGDIYRAVAECQAVIHVAADTSQRSQSYKAYQQVNAGGTKRLIEAAQSHGVQKFIYVSSANTLGYGNLESPGTETMPLRYPFSHSLYARSKKEAEDAALHLGKTGKMEVVIVHPCFMIGPYDRKPSSGAILLRAYQKRLLLAPPGGKNFVHVRDAASAITQAITRGKNGEHYLLGGENMSYATFYRRMREITADRFRILIIPPLAMKAAGVIGSMLASCGISNAFHLNNMRILCVKNYYSPRKAIEQIGLPQTPVSTAIAEATEWFTQAGMRSPKAPPTTHKLSFSS